MATAIHTDASAPARRREILEWYSGLQGKGPAQVLGVSRDADPTAVRVAFVALAKRFHPDAVDEDDADLRGPLQAIFIRITEAYRELRGTQAAKPPRPEVRPAPVAVPRKREAAPPPPRAPRPAPALDPETKHASVAEALGVATALLAERDLAAAVDTLHEVLGLADDAERRRIRLLLARAYVSEPKWRRYGFTLLGEILHESPDDAEALTTLGALYHREGLMARAEATLRRALDSDPGHGEARTHLRAVTAALEVRRAHEAARPPERRGFVARLLSFAR
jgi:tetratricopeptide (TPR) repeat protein